MSKLESSLFEETDDVEAAANARAEADIAAGRVISHDAMVAVVGNPELERASEARRVVWTEEARFNLAAIRGCITP